MRKYLFTMVVMTIFAIGFAASDEEESSNNSSSNEAKQEVKAEPEGFLKKGNKYVSTKHRAASFDYSYELTYFDDGTVELIEYSKCWDGNYKDETIVYDDCTIQRYDRSKNGVRKKWYRVDGYCSMNTRAETLLIEDNGHATGIILLSDDDGYDYVGRDYQYTFRKQ